MNRYVALWLVVGAVTAAKAQVGNGPAPPPQTNPGQAVAPQQQPGPMTATSTVEPATVEAESDGKCRDARPGDTVNFSLTIEAVEKAKAVYGELQMREGHSVAARAGSLPMPDYRNLSGGGLGVRDTQISTLYHFSFRVPEQIVSGLYHGMGVAVTADRAVTLTDRDHAVDVTRHTRDEVKNYCLRVISGFGADGRPVVTDFQPGTVEKPAVPAAPGTRR